MAEGKGLLDFISSPAGQGLLAGAFGALAGRGTRTQAIGQGGLAGLLAYGQATNQQQDMARQRAFDDRQTKLFDMQMAQHQSAQDAQRRRQEYIASLGRGASPSDALAGGGGPTIANAAKIGQTPQFDPFAAMSAGLSPAEAKELASARDWGMPEVVRTVEVDDGKGGKATMQLDRLGRPVGQSLPGYIAPVQVNRGNQIDFVTPRNGVSLSVGMSPAERDASARGWASNAIARERLSLDQGMSVADAGGPNQAPLVRQFGKAPPGYRWKQDGSVEAIPGGPVDLKAGEAGAKSQMRRQAADAQLKNVLGAVNDAKSLVGYSTAGPGSILANVPGTSARDLQAKLETVKANLGFDRLQQMRDMSPTGGALGAVAVQELTALQSTVSSLDAGQSPEQLRRSLEKIEGHYKRWADAVNAGASAPSASGGAKFLGFE